MQTETTDALLDDPGDLDILDPHTPEPDEPATHLAKCAECASAVRYRPLGAGFSLVDDDGLTTFGVGPHGRPMCPNGHGEMAIADDQLKPAAEAFAEVSQRLHDAAPVQAALPGVLPVFNFQGAYMELEEQALRVESLRKAHEDDAKTARESKKAWDSAELLYTNMAIEFRRRRCEKTSELPDVPEPATGPRLVKCTWESAHPGERCPMCNHEVVDAVLDRLVGSTREATDAEAHIDEVDALLAGLDLEVIVDALQAIDTYIDSGEIASWSKEDRDAVLTWAETTLDKRDKDDVTIPARPAVLGKPHIPAAAVEGIQRCSVCEEPLVRSSNPSDAYQLTDYVGTDCKGAHAKGHRYPARGKKKAGKRAKKEAA